jgi:hypothetical protein
MDAIIVCGAPRSATVLNPFSKVDETLPYVASAFGCQDSYVENLPDVRGYDPIHVVVFVDPDNRDMYRAGSREEEMINNRITTYFKGSLLFLRNSFEDILAPSLLMFPLHKRAECRLREFGLPSYMQFLGWPTDARIRSPNSAKTLDHVFACIEQRDRNFELPIFIVGITCRPFDRASAYMVKQFVSVTFIHYASDSSVIRMLEAILCRYYSSHPECWNVAGGGDGLTDTAFERGWRGPYFLYFAVGCAHKALRA